MREMSRPPTAVLATPSVQRLKRIALALGEFAEEVVFIGGAIAPLLQLDPPFPEARPTKDIDGVVASTVIAPRVGSGPRIGGTEAVRRGVNSTVPATAAGR